MSSVAVAVHDETGPSELADNEVDAERWQKLAIESLRTEGIVSGELNLVFVGSDQMAQLNQQHMDGVGPTDVLAFPIDGLELEDPGGDGVPAMLGDVVVCPTVAAANATVHEVEVDDEIALLVVHGILHVLGHDHVDPAETALMKRKEQELLDRHHHP
ncbi:MAG: rRNA maturation RNase YbeY [Acidimicrobiales bacterium]